MKQPVLNLDLYLEIERIKEEKDQEAENQTRPTTGATDLNLLRKTRSKKSRKSKHQKKLRKPQNPELRIKTRTKTKIPKRIRINQKNWSRWNTSTGR